MPGDADGHKKHYKCSFYNNTDVAYVASNGVFDFVKYFKTYAPKAISKVSLFAVT